MKPLLRNLSIAEWCIAGVIILTCVIMLVPSPEWASSGTMTCPVEVLVFNVKDGSPIESAKVDILRIPLSSTEHTSLEYAENFSGVIRVIEQNEFAQTTSAQGIALFNMEFNTSASHKNPKTSASTELFTVLVSTKNFGTMITPLRYQSTPIEHMKVGDKINFRIGLWPSELQ